MLLVIGTRVFQIETFRQVVIHLNRTQLPFPTDSVFHHEVQFRTVERGFTQFHGSCQTFLGSSLDDGSFRLLPVLVRTDIFLLVIRVSQRYLRREVLEIQRFEDREYNINHFLELILQLIGRTEQVSVILSKTAYPCQPVQFTTLLVTIHRTELGKTHRKILVRAGLKLVYLAMMRAVHRFQHELLAFLRRGDHLETILPVLLEMPGSLVQIHVTDMRGNYLLVTVFLLYLSQESLQTVAQHSAFRQPHG